MKRLTLVAILILTIIQGLKGQNYVAFPTKDVQWNVYMEYSIHENPTDTVIMRYVFDGDTTINQIKYNKLCLKRTDSDTSTITPIGGLREENKKIYFIGNDFLGYPHEQELVLYDFNKQTGDTVFHDYYQFSIIEKIDSIEIDGSYRKRYKIGSNSRSSNYYFPNDEYWIEGIGSIKSGLLGHITSIPTCCYQFWEHVCFKENNGVKYLNPNFDSCEPSFLKNNIDLYILKSKIKIYPNPTDKELFVKTELSEVENIIVEIFDIKGNMLKWEQICDEETLISLPQIKGILNVVVMTLDGQIIKSEKIIKK